MIVLIQNDPEGGGGYTLLFLQDYASAPRRCKGFPKLCETIPIPSSQNDPYLLI